MISPAPARSSGVNAPYEVLGEYVQDDSRIPYHNPADSDVMIEPGEPLAVTWGAGATAVMAQAAIFPGETGTLNRYFTGDFPCDVSANVLVGAEVYWDADTKKVSLAADVTNGFLLGHASWAIDPVIRNQAPALSAGKVIAATTASTKIRVIGLTGATTLKGAVTPMSLAGAPAPAQASSKSSKSKE